MINIDELERLMQGAGFERNPSGGHLFSHGETVISAHEILHLPQGYKKLVLEAINRRFEARLMAIDAEIYEPPSGVGLSSEEEEELEAALADSE